jgi:hypothetical protein
MRIGSLRPLVPYLAMLLGTASTPTLAASPPKGLCFNYGHDGYVHDLSPGGQVAEDFRRLSAGGVHCLRIVYNGFNDAQAEALARFAKARGFYVITGGEWGMLDMAQLPQYRAQAMQHAKWAQANGIDQFSVGNEQEARLSGISFELWASEMVALAADVRAVFYGTVSYEAGGNFADDWAKVSIGSLDLLGINSYGGYERNALSLRENMAAHGASRVYLSETNCDAVHVLSCRVDGGLSQEMKGDLLRLMREFPETAFYIYTWRAIGHDVLASMVNYPQTLAMLGIR